MNPEIKKKWIEALRSGKYEQGRYQLRQQRVYTEPYGTDLYCCLGVLCDLVEPGQWSPAASGGQNLHRGQGSMISKAVMAKVKIPDEVAYALAKMNDEGKTFEAIADWIERHL